MLFLAYIITLDIGTAACITDRINGGDNGKCSVYIKPSRTDSAAVQVFIPYPDAAYSVIRRSFQLKGARKRGIVFIITDSLFFYAFNFLTAKRYNSGLVTLTAFISSSNSMNAFSLVRPFKPSFNA